MTLIGSALVSFGVWFIAFTWINNRRPAPLKLSSRTGFDQQRSRFNETVIRAQGELIRRLMPPARRRRLEQVIAKAGQPKGYTLERMVTLKIIGAIAGGLLGLSFFGQQPSALGALVLIIGPVSGFVVPEMLVSNRADARREEVRASLPDAIDQLAVTVRAGLSVDAALVRVSTTLRGPLAEELSRVVQDIQLGIARTDALKAMAERMDIPELSVFVRALVQADSLGIPVAETLTNQAEEMRLKRRQRAEEQAMKLPVKILAPMTVCILPSLMIIVMGPSLLQVVRNL